MTESNDMNPVQERRIGSEVSSLHYLVKWMMAIIVTNFGVILLGGMSVWVNDGNQDKRYALHAQEFIILRGQMQTKDRADLQLKIQEEKIENAKSYNKGIKAAVGRIETELKKRREGDE